MVTMTMMMMMMMMKNTTPTDRTEAPSGKWPVSFPVLKTLQPLRNTGKLGI